MRLDRLAIAAALSFGTIVSAQSESDDPPPPIAKRKASPTKRAPSERDIDLLTSYATMLGRAIGCGLNVDSEMKRVGRWMDRKFPSGSERQKTYLPIFLDGVKYHARQQKEGKSPDSCETVRREFRSFPWP